MVAKSGARGTKHGKTSKGSARPGHKKTSGGA